MNVNVYSKMNWIISSLKASHKKKIPWISIGWSHQLNKQETLELIILLVLAIIHNLIKQIVHLTLLVYMRQSDQKPFLTKILIHNSFLLQKWKIHQILDKIFVWLIQFWPKVSYIKYLMWHNSFSDQHSKYCSLARAIFSSKL